MGNIDDSSRHACASRGNLPPDSGEGRMRQSDLQQAKRTDRRSASLTLEVPLPHILESSGRAAEAHVLAEEN